MGWSEERRRKEELFFVQQHEATSISRGQCWFMLDAQWMERWWKYATNDGPPPGPISNEGIVQEGWELRLHGDAPGDADLPRENLQLSVDYHCVTPLVWCVLVELHGSSRMPPMARYTKDIYSTPLPAVAREKILKTPLMQADVLVKTMAAHAASPQHSPKQSTTPALGNQVSFIQAIATILGAIPVASWSQVHFCILLVQDVLFRGLWGQASWQSAAVAAIWITFPSCLIIHAITAVDPLCLRAEAVGAPLVVGVWLQAAFVFATIATIPVALWYYYIHETLGWVIQDAALLSSAQDFSSILALGVWPQFIMTAIASVAAAQGITASIGVSYMASWIVNALLNYELPSRGYGIQSVAIATVASLFLQVVFFTLYAVCSERFLHGNWSGWRIESLCRLPAFAIAAFKSTTGSLDALVLPLLLFVSTALGTNGLAVESLVLLAIFSVRSFINAIISGSSLELNGKFSPQRALAAASFLVVFVGIAIFVIEWWGASSLQIASSKTLPTPPLLSLPRLLEVSLIMDAVVAALFVWLMDRCDQGFFNSVGKLGATVFVFLPLAYIMSVTWQWGVPGVCWAFLASNVWAVIALCWAAVRGSTAVASLAGEETQSLLGRPGNRERAASGGHAGFGSIQKLESSHGELLEKLSNLNGQEALKEDQHAEDLGEWIVEATFKIQATEVGFVQMCEATCCCIKRDDNESDGAYPDDTLPPYDSHGPQFPATKLPQSRSLHSQGGEYSSGSSRQTFLLEDQDNVGYGLLTVVPSTRRNDRQGDQSNKTFTKSSHINQATNEMDNIDGASGNGCGASLLRDDVDSQKRASGEHLDDGLAKPTQSHQWNSSNRTPRLSSSSSSRHVTMSPRELIPKTSVENHSEVIPSQESSRLLSKKHGLCCVCCCSCCCDDGEVQDSRRSPFNQHDGGLNDLYSVDKPVLRQQEKNVSTAWTTDVHSISNRDSDREKTPQQCETYQNSPRFTGQSVIHANDSDLIHEVDRYPVGAEQSSLERQNCGSNCFLSSLCCWKNSTGETTSTRHGLKSGGSQVDLVAMASRRLSIQRQSSISVMLNQTHNEFANESFEASSMDMLLQKDVIPQRTLRRAASLAQSMRRLSTQSANGVDVSAKYRYSWCDTITSCFCCCQAEDAKSNEEFFGDSGDLSMASNTPWNTSIPSSGIRRGSNASHVENPQVDAFSASSQRFSPRGSNAESSFSFHSRNQSSSQLLSGQFVHHEDEDEDSDESLESIKSGLSKSTLKNATSHDVSHQIGDDDGVQPNSSASDGHFSFDLAASMEMREKEDKQSGLSEANTFTSSFASRTSSLNSSNATEKSLPSANYGSIPTRTSLSNTQMSLALHSPEATSAHSSAHEMSTPRAVSADRKAFASSPRLSLSSGGSSRQLGTQDSVVSNTTSSTDQGFKALHGQSTLRSNNSTTNVQVTSAEFTKAKAWFDAKEDGNAILSMQSPKETTGLLNKSVSNLEASNIQLPSQENELTMAAIHEIMDLDIPATSVGLCITPQNSLDGWREARVIFCMSPCFCFRFFILQLLADLELVFLGHMGVPQLAGAVLVRYWIAIPCWFFNYCMQAVYVLGIFARRRNENRTAGLWLQTGLAFAFIATVFVIYYYFHTSDFVRWTEFDPLTINFGRQYAPIMLVGLFPLLVHSAMTNYMKIQQIQVPIVVCATVACIVNIALQFLFIYGAFGWHGWGFVGSPWATVTGLIVQCVLFILYTVSLEGYHKRFWSGWTRQSLRFKQLRIFLVVGAPLGAMALAEAIVYCIIGTITSYIPPPKATSRRLDESDDAGAIQAGAWAISFCLFLLILALFFGIAEVTKIRMTAYIASGEAKLVRGVLSVGVGIAVAVGALFSACLYFLSAPVFLTWLDDVSMLSICIGAVPWIMVCIVIASVRVVLAAGLIVLMKRPMVFLSQVIDMCMVKAPFSFVFPILLFIPNLTGFWMAVAMGESVHVILLVYALCQKSSEKDEAALFKRAQTMLAIQTLNDDDDNDRTNDEKKIASKDDENAHVKLLEVDVKATSSSFHDVPEELNPRGWISDVVVVDILSDAPLEDKHVEMLMGSDVTQSDLIQSKESDVVRQSLSPSMHHILHMEGIGTEIPVAQVDREWDNHQDDGTSTWIDGSSSNSIAQLERPSISMNLPTVNTEQTESRQSSKAEQIASQFSRSSRSIVSTDSTSLDIPSPLSSKSIPSITTSKTDFTRPGNDGDLLNDAVDELFQRTKDEKRAAAKNISTTRSGFDSDESNEGDIDMEPIVRVRRKSKACHRRQSGQDDEDSLSDNETKPSPLIHLSTATEQSFTSSIQLPRRETTSHGSEDFLSDESMDTFTAQIVEGDRNLMEGIHPDVVINSGGSPGTSSPHKEVHETEMPVIDALKEEKSDWVDMTRLTPEAPSRKPQAELNRPSAEQFAINLQAVNIEHDENSQRCHSSNHDEVHHQEGTNLLDGPAPPSQTNLTTAQENHEEPRSTPSALSPDNESDKAMTNETRAPTTDASNMLSDANENVESGVEMESTVRVRRKSRARHRRQSSQVEDDSLSDNETNYPPLDASFASTEQREKNRNELADHHSDVSVDAFVANTVERLVDDQRGLEDPTTNPSSISQITSPGPVDDRPVNEVLTDKSAGPLKNDMENEDKERSSPIDTSSAVDSDSLPPPPKINIRRTEDLPPAHQSASFTNSPHSSEVNESSDESICRSPSDILEMSGDETTLPKKGRRRKKGSSHDPPPPSPPMIETLSGIAITSLQFGKQSKKKRTKEEKARRISISPPRRQASIGFQANLD
ncbi:hypothetical protein AeNC1_009314 [Aphanomyces euteiches]|nr:hypothetical protein AeNC1_009314 [Aphanomyces euteiches]